MAHSTVTIPGVQEKSKIMTPSRLPVRQAETLRVPLAMTFEDLLGDDQAADETADEIIQAVRQSRDLPSIRKTN